MFGVGSCRPGSLPVSSTPAKVEYLRTRPSPGLLKRKATPKKAGRWNFLPGQTTKISSLFISGNGQKEVARVERVPRRGFKLKLNKSLLSFILAKISGESRFLTPADRPGSKNLNWNWKRRRDTDQRDNEKGWENVAALQEVKVKGGNFRKQQKVKSAGKRRKLRSQKSIKPELNVHVDRILINTKKVWLYCNFYWLRKMKIGRSPNIATF